MHPPTARPDLALFTGTPAFAEPLHVGRPNVGDRARLLERIEGMLDRKWFTNDGPLVREFEQRIADYTHVGNCVAVCNATVALELVTRALEFAGEVIVPSYTFVATAHALQWQGITPVFCDIDPATHNIDPARIESLITPRTTGIVGVHLWGRACDVHSLSEIARNRRLKLVFDAAHAFGCSCKGEWIGGFGSAEVFSFHATKFLNSFEGGAVVTNDDALAAKLRLMRNFGFAGYDNVIYIGTNGKMAEVAAAMGITSLESIDAFVETNRRNYEAYRQQLAGLPGIRVLQYDPAERSNYQYVVLEVDSERCPLCRDDLLEVLGAENVLARKYFWPGCHRMEPYRSDSPDAHQALPMTEAVANQVLLLPTGTSIAPDAVGLICRVVRTALARSLEVIDRLRQKRTLRGGD